MSAGDEGPVAAEPGNAATGDSHAYFRAIEDAFVALRGAPLLLSPADYQVASAWHRDGVPLGLVLATLREVFARRQDRGAKGRINGLRYCKPAVDAAWAEVRELQGPGRSTAAQLAAEAPAADARLAELVDALPDELADRESWAARLTALAGPPEAVEEGLRALDAELIAAAQAGLDEEKKAQLEAEVEAILDGLRDRFPDAELIELRAQLYRQRLRRALSLPVLTLF